MTEPVIQARVRRKPEKKAMEIAMEVMANPSISLLDQLKIEAQILHPVLQALRAELGKQRADELVAGAVRNWRREVIVRAGSAMPGSPREKFETFMDNSGERIGGDVDFDWLRRDADVMEVDVTGCRYADLFHSLDEPGARRRAGLRVRRPHGRRRRAGARVQTDADDPERRELLRLPLPHERWRELI